MRTLNLDILKEGLPGVTPVMGAFYLEAAIVSLTKSGHVSGAKLKLKGDFDEEFIVVWSEPVSLEVVGNWKEEKVHVSHGAVAIALCLLKQLLDFKYFEEGRFGTGIDFWLGKEKAGASAESLAKWEARAEISGMMKETKGNTFSMRLSKKKVQMTSSDHSHLPGWVVLVEFNTPKAIIKKK